MTIINKLNKEFILVIKKILIICVIGKNEKNQRNDKKKKINYCEL